MLLLSIPAMYLWRLPGLLMVWAAAEAAQLLYLLHLNRRLFGREATLSFRAVGLLMLSLVVGSVACLWPVFHIASMPLTEQALVATAVTLVALLGSYWIFRVDEVRSFVWQRVRPSAAAGSS
jgi:heme/copper-type cytochrome/quinol oxidase subunit 4